MTDRKSSTTKQIEKKGIEKIEAIVHTDNENFKQCLNQIAGTKEGQYVLNRLLTNCGQNRSSVIQNEDGSTDKGSIEYREGRRSIWIYELCKYLSDSNLKKILFINRRRICQAKKKIQEES